MVNELWKICSNYPTIEVSNLGNCRRTKDKNKKYLYVSKQGYYVTEVKVKGKRKLLKLHRLVAEAFLNPPEKELIEECSRSHWGVVCVNHIDGNKLNNNVYNLEWCTDKVNSDHAWSTGLCKHKGSSHIDSKFTDDQIIEVRDRAKTERQIDLAREFGVCTATMNQIIHRKTYKDVK